MTDDRTPLLVFDDVPAQLVDAWRDCPGITVHSGGGIDVDDVPVGVVAGRAHAARAYELARRLPLVTCLILLDSGSSDTVVAANTNGESTPNFDITTLSTSPLSSPETTALATWRHLTSGRFEVRLLPSGSHAGDVAVRHVEDSLRRYRDGRPLMVAHERTP